MAESLRVHQIIWIEFVAKAEMLSGTFGMAPERLRGLLFPNEPKVGNLDVNSAFVVLLNVFFAKPTAKITHASCLFSLVAKCATTGTSDNQINSSGMPLSCSDKLQLGGLSFLLDQRAPSRTHFSLKRSTPVFVASWYPCSTPQQGQTSKTGVAPSSPQGGLKSQYPQTLQLCAFLIAKCHIPMPCQRNYRNSLRGKQFHRKENHKSHEPDLPASQRGVDGAPCKLRVARIGAIGNAVVPFIPEMIGNAILLAINSPMKSTGTAPSLDKEIADG